MSQGRCWSFLSIANALHYVFMRGLFIYLCSYVFMYFQPKCCIYVNIMPYVDSYILLYMYYILCVSPELIVGGFTLKIKIKLRIT